MLHVFPAGRPCLHTAQCLTAAGDWGVGGGAGQHCTWIYYHLYTSGLVLLTKILYVGSFFKPPRVVIIIISGHFSCFMGN